MSDETIPYAGDSGAPFKSERIKELLQTIDHLSEDNRRLIKENLELKESLAQAQAHQLANQASRRAALNLMEDAIAARAEACQDNMERRRIEEELRAAGRRKDEFLATLAHELRNPLSPIRNSLEILRLAGGGGGATDHIYETLERQVTHMVRLVDDLLEVSRITRGQFELRKERVSLATIVRAAVELSQPRIDAAGHQLAISLPVEPISIVADQTRLSQVISNLLDNAAKYTAERGQIWVTAECNDADVVISVRDNGLGIPKDMLPNVFDLFTQVDRTLGRAQGGLGIGLTLVRSLVAAHGGIVEARSGGVDSGSEFIVRLPRTAQEDCLQEAVGHDERPMPGPVGRILVVDDNHDATESLAFLLRLLGNETVTAYSGEAALARAMSYKPDVMFLDIGMPEMDGNEVARRVRARAELENVTLIALTGWGQAEDRRRTSEAGFDHHLLKPIDFATLKEVLSSVACRHVRSSDSAMTEG